MSRILSLNDCSRTSLILQTGSSLSRNSFRWNRADRGGPHESVHGWRVRIEP
ncbi:hypothetical protein NPIL_415201, partial [Nephila pilipes]